MAFGDSFLTTPDLFPARAAGEPWGTGSVQISFSGGPYQFHGLSTPQVEFIEERYGDFLANGEEEAAIEVRMFRAHPDDFVEIERAGWDYWIDFDYGPADVRLAGDGFIGRLAWNPGLSGAIWTPGEDGDSTFLCAFENFFRTLVAYRLVECGGALLHSAGVIDDGRAHLFVGHSGAGKSTLSRLSLETGREVLSDDINALMPDGDRTLAEKLPFAGDLGPTSSASDRYPVEALYRLDKGDCHKLTPLGNASAVALLIACSPFINGDFHRLDRLTANLDALVASVPAGSLTFRPDHGFWAHLTADGRP